jgi:Tfp pilus assembly PilM family ATPase
MKSTKSCVGFSLTSSKLQFVEIEKKSDLLQVINLGQTFFSPQLNFEDHNENYILEHLQSAFDELKIRHPISSTIGSFVFPPELFLTIQLPYDSRLNQNEIREEFSWELSQLFPFVKVEDLALKFYELDDSFLQERKEALVVAFNKKYLMLIKNFCLQNTLTAKLVDNSSITANSFIINHFRSDQKSVRINLFNSKNSLTLFINGSSKPAFVKVFPKEGDNFINSIAKEIKGENLKEYLNTPLQYALVSGEEPEAELLAELRMRTGTMFEKFNPFESLILKFDFHNYKIPVEEFNSFTSAVGIASRFS